MNKTEETLVKGLINLIWADGQVTDHERNLLGVVLANLGLNHKEVEEVGKMMISPPELVDLKSSVPDQGARLEIMKTLVGMALSGGTVDISEVRFLDTMAEELGIGAADLEILVAEVTESVGGGQL